MLSYNHATPAEVSPGENSRMKLVPLTDRSKGLERKDFGSFVCHRRIAKAWSTMIDPPFGEKDGPAGPSDGNVVTW